MTGVAIAINDAAAADTILSVKERVFAANRALPVRRQRLVYRPGARGMEALADDETLGGAGVARDGSAELDVLVEPLTDKEIISLGNEVCWFSPHLCFYVGRFSSKKILSESIFTMLLFESVFLLSLSLSATL